MKKTTLLILFCFMVSCVSAKHIIGGEMFYTYLGAGSTPNTLKYRITLRLFRDDHAPADAAQMPTEVFIGVFNNDNGGQFPSAGRYFVANRSNTQSVRINDFPVCMVNRPNLAYHSADFSFETELPVNTNGYTATYQTCCRIRPIDNIFDSGSGAGSTFSCNIPPGTDSSPQFDASIDAVCGGKKFNLQFTATDPDGDSLSYAFEGAYDGGIATSASNINPSAPPYNDVAYRAPYSQFLPLGTEATIDPKTGIIGGIAPPPGRYVVTVAVTSYRNGLKLATHRKDFIINVSDCDFATAKLKPLGVSCDDYSVTFQNEDFSPLNKTFYWEFYKADSSLLVISNDEKPQITFPDTGYYRYKLVINRGEQCSDSTETSFKLYPGFRPGFSFDGQCINSEVFFTDNSTADFGSVNSWKWDFGIPNATNDTSNIKNPDYTYSDTGRYKVVLTVGSTLGCADTATRIVKMVEKPEFSVSNDTLICSIDHLQLFASGAGTVTWTPNYMIDDVSSFSPVVSPKQTTTYYANYQEGRGCTNIDSVVVNVVDFVTLIMPSDTLICLTDSVMLTPQSDGLKYQWTPGATVLDETIKNAIVFPTGNTTYSLTASIGGCNTTRSISIHTVPYPQAATLPDTAICTGNSLQLIASGGSIYEWTPAIFLDNDNIYNPVATPTRTIQYIVKVNDILGCPKPGYDTVAVTVITPHVDAGPRDTAIVLNEPMQLHATGNGPLFLWTPATDLDNPNISNPVAMLKNDQEYVVRLTTDGNCVATDTIMVKVYNLKPGFYVPNAFTPNSDGLNDVIKPIAFGLRTLKYFRIYNRLGQLVFSTNSFKDAWDGNFKGSPQNAAVFVWTAEAIDFTGKLVKQKGTVTLIK